MCYFKGCRLVLGVAFVLILSGCGAFGREQPTRTPVPTFTPTPLMAANNQNNGAGQATTLPTVAQVVATPVPPTPVPPTNTPLATATHTVTPAPTATPPPTPTETNTPTPSPSPTPAYTFELETAEKFPTDSLAPDVVRVYLYVYSDQEFALADYALQVSHNGALMQVDQISTGGLPEQTRPEPSPYTRFTNMDVIFVTSQAGEWTIQLVNANGQPVGPPAEFQLTDGEDTRELYVRYRRL